MHADDIATLLNDEPVVTHRWLVEQLTTRYHTPAIVTVVPWLTVDRPDPTIVRRRHVTIRVNGVSHYDAIIDLRIDHCIDGIRLAEYNEHDRLLQFTEEPITTHAALVSTLIEYVDEAVACAHP